MKTLITGTGGQDGQFLAQQSLAAGEEVWGLVSPAQNPALSELELVRTCLPDVKVIEGDLLDQASLARAIGVSKPDIVYHLAAISSPVAAEAAPELMVQATGVGTLRLLEALRLVQSPARVVLAASDDCFGFAPAPQGPDTPLRPLSLYGAAKVLAVNVLRVYRARFSLAYSVAFLFNHTSELQSRAFLLPRIAAAAAAGDPLQLSLKDRRDWSYAGDVAAALRLIGIAGQDRDYAVGSGVTRTVEEAAQEAYSAAGRDWWRYVQDRGGPVDPREPRADVQPLLALGWAPTKSFQDIMALLVVRAREGARPAAASRHS